ncbi:MAG: S-layer homology domain-containing protein [Chloroflexota bacterium]|nr:S-layer homology domain-containing protein [Chloroflexota bacterium]MDQ5864262.1 S-layer homology domain-containing protein [Chloroflexota bacterium]
MKSRGSIQTRWLVSAAGMLIILAMAFWSTSSALASPATEKGTGQPVATATAPVGSQGAQSQAGNARGQASVAGDSCGVNSNYTVASSTGGTVTSGTTRVDNSQCDNCSVNIALPFGVQLYDQTFTTVKANSNGVLSFGNLSADFVGSCLPVAGTTYSIFPLAQDLSTSGTGRGIYTTVLGSVPNRIFVVQWKACTVIDENICSANYTFEVRLYEGQTKFDAVYGTSVQSSEAVVGVQKDGTLYTGYQCASGGTITGGTVLTFSQASCPTSTSTSTPTRTATPTNTSTPTATSTAFPSCGPYWRTVSSPNVQGDNQVYMDDVAIISPNDIWAIGESGSSRWGERLHILHWDGHAWSTAQAPAMNFRQIFPRSISASASDNVWVVGGQSGLGTPFLMKWNGSQWSQVHLPPALANLVPNLYSVEALAPDNVWVAGTVHENQRTQTFIMHWDGSQWARVASPSLGTGSNYLREISAVSANDIWAVGRYQFEEDGDSLPIILHWNGIEWSTTSFSMPGTEGMLYAVDAVSSNDVWAAGVAYDEHNELVLILHWDGSVWRPVASPYPPGYAISIRSIAGVSPNEAWLVGSYWTVAGHDPYQRSMVQRWNGTSWSLVTIQDPTNEHDALYGVDAIAPGEAWAVGHYTRGTTGNTLTMHYSDPCVTPTSTSTATRTATATATRTSTSTATATATRTSTSTATAIASSTSTSIPTATNTMQAVASATSTRTSTAIATSTASNTVQPLASATRTPTQQVPGVSTSTATATQALPSATRTATQSVPGSTSTATQVPATATRVPATATPQGGAGECQLQFPDVPEGSAFYGFVRCLACRGILGGYSDGTFGPGNLITRGQIAKIVSNAAGFTDTPAAQLFQDVTPDSPFYAFIYRLSMPGRVFMSGYPCGGSGEPCGAGNLPYFRPGANATRGQLSKIVANAAGFNETPAKQSFEDVPTNSAFYSFIERLSSRGYISGYACGAAGEPCGGGNLPYFRPNSSVTRGQAAKIVANTFFPNCDTK